MRPLNSGVDAIVVDHGLADTMCPLIVQATDAGIPSSCTTSRSPGARRRQRPPRATPAWRRRAHPDAEDNGTDINVGCRHLGIAPLDHRDVVWNEFKDQQLSEQWFVGVHRLGHRQRPFVDAALAGNPRRRRSRTLRRTARARSPRCQPDRGDINIYGTTSQRRHRGDDGGEQPWASRHHRPHRIGAAVMHDRTVRRRAGVYGSPSRRARHPGWLLENEVEHGRPGRSSKSRPRRRRHRRLITPVTFWPRPRRHQLTEMR